MMQSTWNSSISCNTQTPQGHITDSVGGLSFNTNTPPVSGSQTSKENSKIYIVFSVLNTHGL